MTSLPIDHERDSREERAQRLQQSLEEAIADTVYPARVRLPPSLFLGAPWWWRWRWTWRANRPPHVTLDLWWLHQALRAERQAAAQLERSTQTPQDLRALARPAEPREELAHGRPRQLDSRVPRWFVVLVAALIYCAVLRAAIALHEKPRDAGGPLFAGTGELLEQAPPPPVNASLLAPSSQGPTASATSAHAAFGDAPPANGGAPAASAGAPAASGSAPAVRVLPRMPPRAPRRVAPAKRPKPCSDVCDPWRCQ